MPQKARTTYSMQNYTHSVAIGTGDFVVENIPTKNTKIW